MKVITAKKIDLIKVTRKPAIKIKGGLVGHSKKLVDILRKNGKMTRRELAAAMNLPLSQVSDIIYRLKKRKVIRASEVRYEIIL
jgi:transcription initiation factor IIE alpha subunit